MRVLLKFLFYLILLALVVAGGAWVWAGRMAGPVIEVRQPGGGFIGQASTLEMAVRAPNASATTVNVVLEQGGKSYPVFANEPAKPPADGAKSEAADRLLVMRPIGKKAIPELKSGPARLVIRAARPVMYGIRNVETNLTKDLQVRLEPPRVTVLSTFHFVNLGGSEFAIFRVTPDDVQSGVRVGDREYPSYPASGAGITTDPALRVAFFALLYDQPTSTRIDVFARDAAGNQVVVPLDYKVFPKAYKKSRIEVDDRFLGRVVPAIASTSADEQIPTDDLLAGFLKINDDLRRKNNQYIRDLAKKTSPELLFMDAFQQLGNSAVQAQFADARTYVYKGKEIDQQVHLGFDLATTANAPISASQRGVVVHADDLGIYGNCVVIDHGMGIQSLYGHLSSIGVKVGDKVEKGQEIGRSGQTGLAGGDHLHFTTLVGGEQVTPVDWWSVQWLQDRVLRKIAAARGTP
ncbi:MAG TPA: M23 family metallopeptidase [Vicinamibacterales bacterium]|nr:M23 family metallopeptidase [Vicinamibacterales bacterium]